MKGSISPESPNKMEDRPHHPADLPDYSSAAVHGQDRLELRESFPVPASIELERLAVQLSFVKSV